MTVRTGQFQKVRDVGGGTVNHHCATRAKHWEHPVCIRIIHPDCSLPWKKRGKAVQVRAQWYQQAMCYGCFRNQSRLIRSTCRKSHGSPHPSQTWLCLMKLLRSSSSPPPPSPSLPSVENSACLVCWTSDRLVNCFDRLCLQPGQSVCDKHPGRHQLIVNCKDSKTTEIFFFEEPQP